MDYNNESITQLKGADRVRNRPAAILGSNGLDGAKHTIYEIVGNATDERLAGYGDALDVCLYEDDSISVRDYGRGVPLGWNEKEQNWNYFLVYEELYAGGKYGDNQDVLRDINERNAWDTFDLKDYPYLITVGLNGLGAAATQCTSEFCTVSSIRDGVASTMEYQEGAHALDELKHEDTSASNGTLVHWKPDPRVFSETKIPGSWIDKFCRSLTYTVGFDVNFNNKGKLHEYKHTTILDVIKQETGVGVSAHNFTHVKDEVGDICICDCTIALGAKGMTNEYYNNAIEVKGGVHSGAFNTALYNFFYKIGTKSGVKIKESDYSGMFSAIICTLANKVSYRSQTKDSLDDGYVYNCIFSCVYDALNLEYEKGTEWLMSTIEDVISNAQNRIAVAEMSKSLREIERSTKKHVVSEKFHTCRSYVDKKVAETEFWIVEGDSAGGQFEEARDFMFQCYLAIRGKSLNVYKATIDKLIANREIKDIISALGCGIDLGIDGYESFNINNLKVGKIIFGTDADIDGLHIRMLLFLIFYKLFPELLYQGYVYVAETPLYVILTKSNEEIYCMNEDELKEKREEVGEMNIREITRFKGLGETSPEILSKTTVNPETRHLRQIKIDRNDAEIYDVLEILFGKSTERRKRAILGSMLGTDFDATMESIDDMVNYIEGLDLNQLEVEEIEY